MIKIGITPCFMYPDPSRVVFGHKSLTYLEHDMAKYLYRKGDVMPVLLLELGDGGLDEQLEGLSGIVFSGGSDIDPMTYGEPYLNKEKWPGDKVRDAFEKKVFFKAQRKRMPLFGICRGAQLINACMGGTLYQDIFTEVPKALKHRDAVEYDKIHHRVDFSEDGVLRDIYQKDGGTLNSVHHQGIKNLGLDLVVEGICPTDKLIEAFRAENMERQYILGVQWHPEFSPTLGDKVLDPDPLYDHFLTRAKEWKS